MSELELKYSQSDYRLRWEKIQTEVYNKLLVIPQYENYVEKVRAEKIKEDRTPIFTTALTQSRKLFEDVTGRIAELANSIHGMLSPNLNSDDPMKNLIGEMQIKNANDIIASEPSDIEKITKDALEQKRIDFVFYLCQRLLGSKKVGDSYKMRVRFIYDEAQKQLGFSDLQDEKRGLEYLMIEIKDGIAQLETAPEMFEAKIQMRMKGIRAMEAAGQLEGETVIL